MDRSRVAADAELLRQERLPGICLPPAEVDHIARKVGIDETVGIELTVRRGMIVHYGEIFITDREHPRPDGEPPTMGVGFGRSNPRIGERLGGGGEGETMGTRGILEKLAIGHRALGVEVFHLGTEGRGKATRIKTLRRGGSAFSFEESRPGLGGGVPDGGDHADSGHGDSAFFDLGHHGMRESRMRALLVKRFPLRVSTKTRRRSPS